MPQVPFVARPGRELAQRLGLRRRALGDGRHLPAPVRRHSLSARTVEGYLVPVVLGEAKAVFDDAFLRRFRGSGIWRAERRPLDGDVVKDLTEAVASIAYWRSVPDEVTPHALQLDHSRLPDADEARLPVMTPDGPGDLVWDNSD